MRKPHEFTHSFTKRTTQVFERRFPCKNGLELEEAVELLRDDINSWNREQQAEITREYSPYNLEISSLGTKKIERIKEEKKNTYIVATLKATHDTIAEDQLKILMQDTTGYISHYLVSNFHPREIDPNYMIPLVTAPSLLEQAKKDLPRGLVGTQEHGIFLPPSVDAQQKFLDDELIAYENFDHYSSAFSGNTDPNYNFFISNKEENVPKIVRDFAYDFLSHEVPIEFFRLYLALFTQYSTWNCYGLVMTLLARFFLYNAGLYTHTSKKVNFLSYDEKNYTLYIEEMVKPDSLSIKVPEEETPGETKIWVTDSETSIAATIRYKIQLKNGKLYLSIDKASIHARSVLENVLPIFNLLNKVRANWITNVEFYNQGALERTSSLPMHGGASLVRTEKEATNSVTVSHPQWKEAKEFTLDSPKELVQRRSNIRSKIHRKTAQETDYHHEQSHLTVLLPNLQLVNSIIERMPAQTYTGNLQTFLTLWERNEFFFEYTQQKGLSHTFTIDLENRRLVHTGSGNESSFTCKTTFTPESTPSFEVLTQENKAKSETKGLSHAFTIDLKNRRLVHTGSGSKSIFIFKTTFMPESVPSLEVLTHENEAKSEIESVVESQPEPTKTPELLSTILTITRDTPPSIPNNYMIETLLLSLSPMQKRQGRYWHFITPEMWFTSLPMSHVTFKGREHLIPQLRFTKNDEFKGVCHVNVSETDITQLDLPNLNYMVPASILAIGCQNLRSIKLPDVIIRFIDVSRSNRDIAVSLEGNTKLSLYEFELTVGDLAELAHDVENDSLIFNYMLRRSLPRKLPPQATRAINETTYSHAKDLDWITHVVKEILATLSPDDSNGKLEQQPPPDFTATPAIVECNRTANGLLTHLKPALEYHAEQMVQECAHQSFLSRESSEQIETWRAYLMTERKHEDKANHFFLRYIYHEALSLLNKVSELTLLPGKFRIYIDASQLALTPEHIIPVLKILLIHARSECSDKKRISDTSDFSRLVTYLDKLKKLVSELELKLRTFVNMTLTNTSMSLKTAYPPFDCIKIIPTHFPRFYTDWRITQTNNPPQTSYTFFYMVTPNLFILPIVRDQKADIYENALLQIIYFAGIKLSILTESKHAYKLAGKLQQFAADCEKVFKYMAEIELQKPREEGFYDGNTRIFTRNKKVEAARKKMLALGVLAQPSTASGGAALRK